MAFSPRSYAQDLASLQSGRSAAQLQLEQMRMQREQMRLQAEQQARVAEAARVGAIGDIINSSLGAVIGGMSNAEKMELAKRDTARQENLATEQIAASQAERAQTELKNIQENIRLQAIGQLAKDSGIKSPSASTTAPVTPPAEAPMVFTPVAQPEWRAAQSMKDLIKTQSDMRSSPALQKALNLNPPVSPPADTVVAQQQDVASALKAPLFATAQVPSTAYEPKITTPAVTTTPTVSATAAPEPVRDISAIGDTIFQGLSDTDKKRLGFNPDKPESAESAKNIIRGMVAAEAKQQEALRFQQKRLELGMIKDQYDLDRAKREVGIDVIKNSILSQTTYDPSFVTGLLENEAVKQSGIAPKEIDGLSRKYFEADDKEKAKFDLEKSLTQAQIRNQNANATEAGARSKLLTAQATNLPAEQALKQSTQKAKESKAALDETNRKLREDQAKANMTSDNERADVNLMMKSWQDEFHNFDYEELVSQAAKGNPRAVFDLQRYFRFMKYEHPEDEFNNAVAAEKERAAAKAKKR